MRRVAGRRGPPGPRPAAARPSAALLGAALLCAALLAAACGSAPSRGAPSLGAAPEAPAPEAAPEALSAATGAASTELLRLQAVELREYRGERLDSIGDFRENSIAGPQWLDPATYRLKVGGMVAAPYSAGLAELAALPRAEKPVTLYCVEGWSARILWEGPLLASIIDRAGPAPEADTLVFRSPDGYSTSLPLAWARERRIILADRMNGQPLAPERGFPFQLVAEDRWGYKWIKWVDSIELTDDPSFRGYWEERGYDNDGSLEGPRRESGFAPDPADSFGY